MYSRLDQIDSSMQKEIIKKSLSGIRFERLLEEYPLSRNELLSVLNGEVPLRYLTNYLSSVSLEGSKILVISDTHLGSELEELKYLDIVYEFASYYGIKIILHGGDLFQSNRRPVKKKYQDPDKQIEYVIKSYPHDSNVTNYLIYGNHDHHILSKNDEYLKIVESRSDIKPLGFKRAYFTWNKFLMSISHSIDQYKLNIPNIDPQLNLIGHRHELKVSGPTNLFLPSLSNDVKTYGSRYNTPGFMVLEMKDGRIYGYQYILNEETKQIGAVNKVYNAKLLPKNLKK